jgi:LmbE family N-acetylglucosaminyl deacetylase
MLKYLFIGAHPDDIEFGAGGTIAKAVSQGIECSAVIFSNSSESLSSAFPDKLTLIKESKAALTHLGLKDQNITFFDYQVRNFPSVRQSILQDLINLRSVKEYDRVFIPNSFDIHQDHNVVNREALRAFKFTTILGYEMPWNHFEGSLRYFNVLSDSDVSDKQSAIEKFTSQSHRFYSSDESIETTLKFRGLQINKTFVEAFEIIRWVER